MCSSVYLFKFERVSVCVPSLGGDSLSRQDATPLWTEQSARENSFWADTKGEQRRNENEPTTTTSTATTTIANNRHQLLLLQFTGSVSSMIPSQGGWPPLASNEEPSLATTQACAAAAAPIQVRILRRPKPHENNQQSRATSRADEKLTASSTASSGLVESGRNSEQHTLPTISSSSASSSHYANDDEWPSIADAESKSLGSQKQKYNVLRKPSDSKLVSNGETKQKAPPEAAVSSIKTKPASSAGHQKYAAQSDSNETNKTAKAPIKTYKERADEYAKARLRILGSAFSDEDKASNDDILWMVTSTTITNEGWMHALIIMAYIMGHDRWPRYM